MLKKTPADCTIFILTYKGLHHLEHLLPTVRQAIVNSPEYNLDVIIVENGKHQASCDFVKEQFPEFRFVFSPVNDYLFSLNPYILKCQSPYIFILNDDMKLDSEVINYVLPLLQKDKDLFAVHCKIDNWDGTAVTDGVRQLAYKRGWLYSYWLPHTDEEIRYTLYGGGGAAIFDTVKFNILGGFDSLYRPAYCEDLDLGHRAWQRGWPIVRHPKAVLYHREGATIGDQFEAETLNQKMRTNQIIWMLRNATHRGFCLWFCLLLPYRMLRSWRVDRLGNKALWWSLPRMPKALWRRWSTHRDKLSDELIMKQLNTIYRQDK